MLRKTFFGLVALIMLAAVFASAAAAQPAQSRPAYLAVGDSLAVGVGATTPDQGHVIRFYNYLRQNPQWQNRNPEGLSVAVSGETSTSMLAPGGQLDRAKVELARNQDADPRNNVEVITVNIGGNDIRTLLVPGQPCAQSAQSAECIGAFTTMVTNYAKNLTVIMGTLRTIAGPNAVIITMTQYNPFSGTGAALDVAGDIAFGQYNGAIKTVVANPSVNAQVADVFPLFKGKGPQLTHILTQDIHPNDSGYAVIFQAFVASLEAVQPVSGLPTSGGSPSANGSDSPWVVWLVIGVGAASVVGGLSMATKRAIR